MELRFQYTQTYRRKLGSLVEFPIHDLDMDVPERYPIKPSNGSTKCQGSDVSTEGTCVDMIEEAIAAEVASVVANDVTSKRLSSSVSHSISSPSNPRHPGMITRKRRGYTNSNLDQSRCLETKYDLYGVVNHQGALGGGHYTSYAKSFVDDQWYYYDDERVRVVEESKVVTPSAYLLFYLRSDMKNMLVKDIFPPNTNTKITDEDIDRFVESSEDRRCNIM